MFAALTKLVAFLAASFAELPSVEDTAAAIAALEDRP